MVIPDANILIYSYNPDTVQHLSSLEWLEKQFAGGETIGLTWHTLWAFIRVGSNPKLWPKPASVGDIFNRIEEWQSQRNVTMLQPGPRHTILLRNLMSQSGVVGSASSDAALAAVAIEHAATLASTDRGFKRFSGLRWINPLEQ